MRKTAFIGTFVGGFCFLGGTQCLHLTYGLTISLIWRKRDSRSISPSGPLNPRGPSSPFSPEPPGKPETPSIPENIIYFEIELKSIPSALVKSSVDT